MKYDYYLEYNEKLVRFESKKEIGNWVNDNLSKLNNNVKLIRRVKKENIILIEDIKDYINKGNNINTQMVNHALVQARKEAKAQLRNDALAIMTK